MIITEEQKQAIQQELNYAVKYQETYDELYDHVLSTIDKIEGTVTFYGTTITKNIIDNEFGGYEGLKEMEKERAKLLFKILRKKHFQNLLRFFNWPAIGITLMLALEGYYIALNPAHIKYLRITIAVLALSPIFWVLYRRLALWYKAWQFNNYSKQSIKDNYIFTAAILSNSLFNLVNLLSSDQKMYAPAVVAVFVCYNIYCFSFFKLYRDEYRINLAR